MRRMRHVLAATAFAALGTLVAFAQAPQQPAGGRAGTGAGAGHPGAADRRVRHRSSSRVSARVTAPTTAASPEPMRTARRWRRVADSSTPAGRTWRAYLSQPAAGGQPAVNARDRIGAGPWFNARGQLIANNVADLHGDVQRDRNQHQQDVRARTRRAAPVNGVGDMPNQHDILTGSDSTGARSQVTWTRPAATTRATATARAA